MGSVGNEILNGITYFKRRKAIVVEQITFYGLGRILALCCVIINIFFSFKTIYFSGKLTLKYKLHVSASSSLLRILCLQSTTNEM